MVDSLSLFIKVGMVAIFCTGLLAVDPGRGSKGSFSCYKDAFFCSKGTEINTREYLKVLSRPQN